jgi:DNA-directed RNA polymerase subunit RPC12/RpoP
MMKAEVKSEPESDDDEKNKHNPSVSTPKRRKTEVNEQLECLGCKKAFPNKRSLRHHISKAVHNGIKSRNGVVKNSYNCLACGMEFQRVTDMDVHLRNDHAGEVHFPCFYCKKSFPTRSLYQRDFEHLCKKQKEKYIRQQECVGSGKVLIKVKDDKV